MTQQKKATTRASQKGSFFDPNAKTETKQTLQYMELIGIKMTPHQRKDMQAWIERLYLRAQIDGQIQILEKQIIYEK